MRLVLLKQSKRANAKICLPLICNRDVERRIFSVNTRPLILELIEHVANARTKELIGGFKMTMTYGEHNREEGLELMFIVASLSRAVRVDAPAGPRPGQAAMS